MDTEAFPGPDEERMTVGQKLVIRLFCRKLIQEGFIDSEKLSREREKIIQERKVLKPKRKSPQFPSSLLVLPGPSRSPATNDTQPDASSSDGDRFLAPPPPKRGRPSTAAKKQPAIAGVPSTSAFEDLEEFVDAGLYERVTELRKEGKWGQTALPALVEPSRPKTHWDYFLEEMKWFAEIFKNDRKRKKNMTKKLSGAVGKYFADKAAEEEQRRSAERHEREARKQCGQVAKIVRDFWKKIDMVVEFGEKGKEEALRRKDLDQHLNTLVSNAEELSHSMHQDAGDLENVAKRPDEPKVNGIANGDGADLERTAIEQQQPPEPHHKKKPSSAAQMEKFAEQASRFQPKGNTLDTADVQIHEVELLDGTLREYQVVGLNWLYALYDKNMNGILADEMGLGKTIQTIALLAHLAREHAVWGPHLIVVPTSVILNWEMEFKRWCPSLKILTYFGSAKKRENMRKGWKKQGLFDVCITSYKLFTQDVKKFKNREWQYLVLDEAQHIKNFESQRWRALINLRTRRRLLLTGTPLQNNLMELWSLLHFLMPNVFSSRDDFKEWFSNPIAQMIEGDGDYNAGIVKRLHKVLRPFILRRLKSEVEKQLPTKEEVVVKCDLSKRQRFLYNEFMSLRSTVDNLRSGSIVSVLNIVMQLRKCCNHPNLFEPRSVQTPFFVGKAPFQPFCRRFFVNKDNDFEKPILRLEAIDSRTTAHRRLSVVTRGGAIEGQVILMRSYLDTGDSYEDRSAEVMGRELFERINGAIREGKSTWVHKSLKHFGIYVPSVIYSPLRQAFFDAPETWYDLYAEKLHFAPLSYFHRNRDEIEEKALVNSMMQFPETRLIQYDCGKLQVLAIMLRRLYQEGHRCLIFTQMSKMLDILQDFLSHHGYVYFRLDGSTGIELRQSLMERFNTDPKIFCFILSTRAGGVGVNLTGADTVIFYDSDWNPTMDAQAQDRCHRIGQTKNVTIYRLISTNTIEENILKKARAKRRLGELTIDEAGFTPDFFKKGDNIRDLFRTEEEDVANRDLMAELETVDFRVEEESVKKAMENAEDDADLMAARKAADEVEIEEREDFESPQPEPIMEYTVSKEFNDVYKSLSPVERYAILFAKGMLDASKEEED